MQADFLGQFLEIKVHLISYKIWYSTINCSYINITNNAKRLVFSCPLTKADRTFSLYFSPLSHKGLLYIFQVSLSFWVSSNGHFGVLMHTITYAYSQAIITKNPACTCTQHTLQMVTSTEDMKQYALFASDK